MDMQANEVLELSSDLRLACMRIARRARSESRNQIPQHQYAVLTQLENGPLTIRTLADREAVSAPVMTRKVNELERLGYVKRQADPSDRRQVLVHLTSEGESLKQRVKRNRDEWMASCLIALSEDELLQLRLTTVILQNLAAS